tara:strand:+ start:1489 stop:3591 length:2103 start_codon:yes stop_codon:yes gene_type:complete
MPLTALKFKPGINREGTSYSNEGGWFDGDKIRFRLGYPEKIGGWSAYSDNTFLGTCRALFSWVALDGTKFLGIGTNLKYYIADGGQYYDVTPIRKTTTGAATFAATNGSATITVTDAAHGANLNDFVTFSSTTSLGDQITATVLNGEHQIIEKVNNNSYKITVSATASGSDSGNGGSSTVAQYQINTGLDTNFFGTGWGAGVFSGTTDSLPSTAINDGSGLTAVATTVTVDATTNFSDAGLIKINDEIIEYTGKTSTTFTGLLRGRYSTTAASHSDNDTVIEATFGWGMPATTTVAGANISNWTHDNFGEDLLMNARNGGIFYWDRNSGTATRAVALSSLSGSNLAPTIAKQIMVSDQARHIIAFGCDGEGSIGTQDPLLIRFSDQESLTAWQTLTTNTAGELRISTGSEIVVAIQTKQQILVFTDVSLHGLQFLGPPFTFGLSEISRNITIASPDAAVAVNDFVFWMGSKEFYAYGGTVQRLPCTVLDYVFSDFNRDQIGKVTGGHNSSYGEVWWFYPSGSSTTNDRYVIYNYQEKVWYYGTLARTAWVDRGINQYPIAASTDKKLYYHEFGQDDGSTNPVSAISANIESAQIDLDQGDKFALVQKIIPDLTFRDSTNSEPVASLTVKTTNFPGVNFNETSSGQTNITRSATTPIEQYTDQLRVRLRGRQFVFRIESTATGTQWRLGVPRIDVRPDGRR